MGGNANLRWQDEVEDTVCGLWISKGITGRQHWYYIITSKGYQRVDATADGLLIHEDITRVVVVVVVDIAISGLLI
jgi:hypothetical protein